MSITTQIYPSIIVQVVLAIAFSIIRISSCIDIEGLWSLQSLIVPSPSNETLSSSNNESGSFTNFEYELTIAVADLAAIFGGCVCGLLLNNIGMPNVTVLFTFIGLLGSGIRSLSHSFKGHHMVAVTCLIIGHSLALMRGVAVGSIITFVDLHYFPTEYRSKVTGIHQASISVGSALVFVVVPRVGLNIGVSSTLWICTVLGFVAFLLSIVVFLMFKSSKDIQQEEVELTNDKTDVKKRSIDGIKSLKSILQTYDTEFWFILFSASLTRVISRVVLSNSMKILTIFLKTTTTTASNMVTTSLILEFILALLSGSILNYFKFKELVAVTGIAVMFTSGIVLAFLSNCSPLVFIPFASAHGIVLTPLLTLIGDHVPSEHVGVASALYLIVSSCLLVFCTFSISFLFKYGVYLSEMTKWKLTLIMSITCILFILLSASILFYRNVRASLRYSKIENEETSSISSRKENVNDTLPLCKKLE